MEFSNTFSLKTVDLIVAVLLLSLCWGMEARSSPLKLLLSLLDLVLKLQPTNQFYNKLFSELSLSCDETHLKLVFLEF